MGKLFARIVFICLILSLIAVFFLIPQKAGKELYYTHQWISEESQLFGRLPGQGGGEARYFLRGQLGSGILDISGSDIHWFPRSTVLAGSGDTVVLSGIDDSEYLVFSRDTGTVHTVANGGIPFITGSWNLFLQEDYLGLSVADSSFSSVSGKLSWAARLTALSPKDSMLAIGFMDGAVWLLQRSGDGPADTDPGGGRRSEPISDTPPGAAPDGFPIRVTGRFKYPAPIRGLAWYDDGQILIYAGQEDQALILLDIDSGEEQSIPLPGDAIPGAGLIIPMDEVLAIERRGEILVLDNLGTDTTSVRRISHQGELLLALGEFPGIGMAFQVTTQDGSLLEVVTDHGEGMFMVDGSYLHDVIMTPQGYLWAGEGLIGYTSFFWKGGADG